MWWSHMKRANHKILGWLRQSHTGGETETRAVAVGAPKVMRAVTSWAATRCFFGSPAAKQFPDVLGFIQEPQRGY